MLTPPSSPGLAFYVSAAPNVHPDLSLGSLRNRLRYVALALKYGGQLTAYLRRPAQRALARELVVRPELMGYMMWPYIHARWPVMQRFKTLSQHHQAMESDMAALSVSPTDSLVVADLSKLCAGLRLVIDRPPWVLREGSLMLSQFLHDERLMSLAFSFGCKDGERVAYVGSVQGVKAGSALADYRELAKKLYGMRSRDFLIKAFQHLAHHLGVKRVLCVGEQVRHHRHPYFGRSKLDDLHLNYDTVWHEHAGVRTEDGLFQLDPLPKVRRMEDIAAKNRSLYRHRYAMMDQLSANIAARLGFDSVQTFAGEIDPLMGMSTARGGEEAVPVGPPGIAPRPVASEIRGGSRAT